MHQVYAAVPRLACQGRCQHSCVPVHMQPHERARILVNHRRSPASPAGATRCALLRRDGACSVYVDRPLICRLWGVVETMPCPFGCRPERWLSEQEALELAALAFSLSIARHRAGSLQ